MNLSRLALLFFLVVWVDGPAVRAEDQIVFLRVRFDSVGVTLESTAVVEGKLKTIGAASVHHGLRFNVVDTDSGLLYSATADDPRRLVLEYFDEDGSIGRMTQERASAVTVIRFPFDPRAARVEFEPLPAATGAQKPLPLGSVKLDLSAHGDKK